MYIKKKKIVTHVGVGLRVNVKLRKKKNSNWYKFSLLKYMTF